MGNIDIYDRAVRAYRRFCNRNGFVFMQPSGSSGWEGDEFVLHNVNGELARYRVTKSGILRLVDREAEVQSFLKVWAKLDENDLPEALDMLEAFIAEHRTGHGPLPKWNTTKELPCGLHHFFKHFEGREAEHVAGVLRATRQFVADRIEEQGGAGLATAVRRGGPQADDVTGVRRTRPATGRPRSETRSRR